jgi:hypothetical protein
MKSAHKTALKALIGLGLLGALIWKIDWRATLGVLKNITLGWVLILLLISFVLIFISCVKWKLFLSVRAVQASLWRLHELYLIGYFFNNFAPSNVGGDVVRGYILGEQIRSQSNSFGTVFLERFTGFVALIGMAVVAAAIRPELLVNRVLAAVLAGMAMGLVLVLVLVVSRRAQDQVNRWLGRVPRKWSVDKLRRFLEVVFYFRSHRGVLLKALALSVMFHVFTIVNTQASCWALGLDADFIDLAVVVPVVLSISAIPISMNALGIMEGAFVFFLALAGLGAAEALSVALVLRAKNLLLALLGGLLFLRWGGKRIPSEIRAAGEQPRVGVTDP